MSTQQEADKIAKQFFDTHQRYSLLGTPPLVYLLILISDLNGEQGKSLLIWLLPILVVVMGTILPKMACKMVIRNAFTVRPEDAPGERLERLLKVPGKVELIMTSLTVTSVAIFTTLAAVLFDKSLWIIPWGVTDVTLIVLLVFVLERRAFESIIRPYAIEEFLKSPSDFPKGGGIFWARQVWLLPYSCALFVLTTLAVTTTILGRGGYDAYVFLLQQVSVVPPSEFPNLLRETASLLARNLIIPVALVGTHVLIVASATAWRLARDQREGTRSIQQTLEGLAQGRPELPKWISTDEIGDLSTAAARVFGQLRSFSLSLKDSAVSLQRSAEQLGQSTSKQTEMLAVQATALQETHVTAEEIKNTSLVAAQKAGNVLQQAERANEISTSGELAIQQGLEGIEEIGTQVRQMATSIRSLDERARQVARITSMVKDLADQSNMLALNAAIEAVRSGESGKGFGVVAKEIRALADQSIRATQSIRSILQDISGAIATASTLTVKGTQRVDASIKQVREFSTQVQQLSAIVRDNAASVRQITAAVTQQDAGITQITQAVQQLTSVMEQTMAQTRSSDEATSVVREVAEQVSSFVSSYGWSKEGAAAGEGLGTAEQPAPRPSAA